jgi:tetratricopeptide (TPR) repeat protein
MQAALGVSPEEFMKDFLRWAQDRARAWGFLASPTMEEFMERARQADPSLREQATEARMDRIEAVAKALAGACGAPTSGGAPQASGWPAPRLPAVRISDEMLDAWLAEQPGHPDLLELKIRRRLKDQPELNDTTRDLLAAYQRARPVDPWPDQLLAVAVRTGSRAESGLKHLQRLDALEERDPAYALEIARILRAESKPDLAMASVEKASRIDGYDPTTRELAAAIAIEAGELEVAMRHLKALHLLEPEVERHAERMERLRRMIEAKATPQD